MRACLHVCMPTVTRCLRSMVACLRAFLKLCLSAWLQTCLHAFVPACVHHISRWSVPACARVRLHVCLSVCMHACLPACLPACVLACLLCLPACPSPVCNCAFLPACLPACLSATLPAYLPVCLPVCVPACTMKHCGAAHGCCTLDAHKRTPVVSTPSPGSNCAQAASRMPRLIHYNSRN